MSTSATTEKRPEPGEVVRVLGRLHGNIGRVIGQFMTVGTLAGGFEAAALVLFTTGALRVTGNDAPTEIGPLSLDTSAGVMLLGAAIAILAAAGLHVVQARLSADASLQILEHARRRVATTFLRASWTAQSQQRDGTLQEGMFHLSQQASQAASFGSGVFNGAVIMFALLVAAFVIAPTLTGLLVVALLPIIFVLRPITKLARRRASENVVQTGALSEEVATTQALAFELQAFGVVDAQIERLDEANRITVGSMRRARFASRLAAYWFKDLALLMFIVLMAVIDLVWDLGQPSAAAAILLIIRMLGYAQQGYNAYQNVVEASPAVLELQRRFDDLDQSDGTAGGAAFQKIGRIEVRDVGYAYPNGQVGLADVSFSIEPNRVLGVVGRSGAGKSTLAELLLRMREPTSGRILVDGVDVNELSLDEWRRRVTIVPQDPRVQRASIADNIVFLRPGYSRADVEFAARASHLHVDIDQFEHGYDSVLGPGNRGMSGGQRQRLAIARALISRPSLLVLDEPTSALDRHSEGRLQETLRGLRSNLSMVIIAHRISTLDLCDDLLVLDHGKVVAFGDRDTIVATEQFFTSLPEAEAGEI